MILDAIIGFFGSLFAFLFEGVAGLFVPIFNLIAAAVEAVVGLFVSGFSMRRAAGKPDQPGQANQPDQPKAARSRTPVVMTLLLIVVGIGAGVIAPKVWNRKVTLVAKDGHGLPYAALIIHTGDGDRHERTDSAGNIVIPRFGTKALTIKDPRYVERKWMKSEIESELTVTRTMLGAGLDALADRLLKPANE